MLPERMPDRAGDDHAGAVTLRLSLRAALLQLSARQHAVLVLRFFEDLHETHLGFARRVPLRGAPAGEARLRRAMFNRRTVREAIIPAATVASTARDLARFYQAMPDGGAGVLSPATIADACRPTSDGEVDRRFGRTIRWAQGFQLGGSDDGDPARALPFGRLSGRRTFGHNGSGTCIG